jgi:hypothetical protein
VATPKGSVDELEPETKEKLTEMIARAWEGIEISLVNSHADSMRERLEEVTSHTE